jgi:hypothetical protein
VVKYPYVSFRDTTHPLYNDLTKGLPMGMHAGLFPAIQGTSADIAYVQEFWHNIIERLNEFNKGIITIQHDIVEDVIRPGYKIEA